MKIVITGALGHIGSFLCLYLAKKNPKAKIIAIDNLLTQRFATIFSFSKYKNISFIEKNLKNEKFNIEINNANVLIHLAAVTDAQSSLDNPEFTKENNFNTTLNIIKTCSSFKVPIIFISTTSIYGTQKDEVDESCLKEDLNPQSPYAIVKLQEEKEIIRYFKANKLKGVILRFGTIFGHSIGMRFHTAVNKFCWQVFTNKHITIWKTAMDQKRPYLSLNDASRSINFIIEKKIYDKNIYNIVSKNSTVRDIINILKTYNKNIKIKFVSSKIMNQLSYNVSASKFTNLGFKFSGNLKKEIIKTLNFLKVNNK